MWQVKCCLSNDGYIAREEMMALLQNCLNLSGQEEEGEDGIKVLKVPECLYSVLSRTWLTWHWRRWTLIKMAGSATKTLRQRLVITSSHSLASFRFRSGSTFNFSMKIEKEPLLLEAFGPCLPRAEALHKFFQQVDQGVHTSYWSTKVSPDNQTDQVMDKPEGIKSIRNFFLGLTWASRA